MVYIQNFQAWNKDVDIKKYILKPAGLEWKASGMTVQCFTNCPQDLQLNRTFFTNTLFLDACWPETRPG